MTKLAKGASERADRNAKTLKKELQALGVDVKLSQVREALAKSGNFGNFNQALGAAAKGQAERSSSEPTAPLTELISAKDALVKLWGVSGPVYDKAGFTHIPMTAALQEAEKVIANLERLTGKASKFYVNLEKADVQSTDTVYYSGAADPNLDIMSHVLVHDRTDYLDNLDEDEVEDSYCLPTLYDPAPNDARAIVEITLLVSPDNKLGRKAFDTVDRFYDVQGLADRLGAAIRFAEIFDEGEWIAVEVPLKEWPSNEYLGDVVRHVCDTHMMHLRKCFLQDGINLDVACEEAGVVTYVKLPPFEVVQEMEDAMGEDPGFNYESIDDLARPLFAQSLKSLDDLRKLDGTVFRFRAECIWDVIRFLSQLNDDEVAGLYLEQLKARKDGREVDSLSDGREVVLPDVEVALSIKGHSLLSLRAVLDNIDDGHVMAQTLAHDSQYTGKR